MVTIRRIVIKTHKVCETQRIHDMRKWGAGRVWYSDGVLAGMQYAGLAHAHACRIRAAVPWAALGHYAGC